jgi:hypothetical protein
MLVALNSNNFNKHDIVIGEKVQNNIMKNSFFYRLNYSSNEYTMNGIYIYFELVNVKCEVHFNKLRCGFNKEKNKEIIDKLKKIEQTILDSFPNSENKIKITHIKNQFDNGSLKIFNDKVLQHKFILKISGFWTNQYEYGVTYKFFAVNHQL